MAQRAGARGRGAEAGDYAGGRALAVSGRVALAGVALLAVSGGDVAFAASRLDLMNLQVFAKQSIQSERSDYEGPVAAGGNVDLSDFEILGNLTSGGRVTFQRGRVKGFVNAANAQLSQVFSSGIGPAPDLATDLAAMKLDLLSARLSSLPATSGVEEGNSDGDKLELRVTARHVPEVIDLQGDQLATGSRETRLAVAGDHDAALLVRVHGRSIHLRHVEFAAVGGIRPTRIVYLFPEASELDISFSGGATDARGRPWNIPGSIVAPNASFKFAASTVTGQVFARSISSALGLAGGQVDKFPTESSTSGSLGTMDTEFTPSQLLQMIASDEFADRFLAHSTAPSHLFSELPAGCRTVCPYHAGLTVAPDSQ